MADIIIVPPDNGSWFPTPTGPTGILNGPTGPTGATGPTGLQGEYAQFLGTFATLTELNTAYPTPTPNQWAFVRIAGDTTNIRVYRRSSNAWVYDTLPLPAGATGATGPTGRTGATGPQGNQGNAGVTGPTGPQGVSGISGTTGPTGAPGQGLNLLGEYATLTALTTARPTGTAGDAWLLANGNLIIWDTPTSAWKNVGNLEGPTGATGSAGPTGSTGPQGALGPVGPQGAQGATGATGTQGPTGLAGPKGDTGNAGPQGISGLQGPTGPTGILGPTGGQGPRGVGYGTVTSVSAVTYGAGTKTFTLANADHAFVSGMRVRAILQSNSSVFIEGLATISNNGLTLSIIVDNGQGTPGTIYSNWIFGVTGEIGAIGDTGPTGPTGATGAASIVAGPTGPAGTSGGIDLAVSANATPNYVINGLTNPNITVIRGLRYRLTINTVGNRFRVQTTQGAYNAATQYTDGFTNLGIETGTIFWDVPFTGASTLYVVSQDNSNLNAIFTLTAAGPQGATGPTGATGAASTVVGPTGSQGVIGPIGPTGPTGAQGNTGGQGIAGLPGAQGPTGAQGPQGNAGATGAPGSAGAVGATGASGVAGPTGAAGASIYVLGTYNDYAALVAAHPFGATGDGYLVNGNLFVWGGSTWINAGFIQGPTGATGAQGAQGLLGPTGAQGNQGTQGIQGVVGPVGPTGATGAQGTQGIQGVQGITGPTGATGAQSTVAGPTGPQGVGLQIKGTFNTYAELLSAVPTGTTGDGYLVAGQLFVWQGVQWANAGTVQGPTGVIGATGPTGAQGVIGLTGATGATGATGSTGAAPFTIIGTWQQGITYSPGQAVFYDTPTLKGTYVRRNNTSTAGITPLEDPANWLALVAATIGVTGPTGPQGLTGLTGVQGPTGNLGPTGPTGNQGLLGPTGPTGTTLLNVDAGTPDTNYGGVDVIDSGGVIQ